MAVRRLRQQLAALARPKRWRESVARALLDGLAIDDPESELRSRIEQQLGIQPSALSQTLKDAWLNPQIAQSHVPQLLTELLAPKPLPAIVSLGTHCFTSGLLRRWGLRSYAGPFDWVFSSAAMVAHCIEDDFATFLDPAQFRPVPVELRKAGASSNRVNHTYYQEQFGVEFVFNHHDVHLPEDFAHYQRTVQRFQAGLQSRDLHVYVLTCWHADGFLDAVTDLRSALARRTSNYRLLAYSVRESQHPQSPQLTPVLTEPDAAAYIFDPISRWEPLQFQDLLDEHCLVHSILKHCRL
jgi:hypothetical protein